VIKDFFISYNKADRNWAEWIAWMLEEAGYSVVIQAWDFRPGGNFVLEMHKAAAGTQKTIAILSEEYLKAEYTHPEWAAAFVRDPQGQERTLIPIRVKKCKPEGLLNATIYVDLVDLSEQEARSATLGAFSARAKPTKAPAFPGRSEQVMPTQVQYPGSTNASTISVSLQPVPRVEVTFSPAQRKELIQKLNALPVQQFNILLFTLNPPAGLIPPMPASQGDRTFALLSWAEGLTGCGLLQVQQILNELTNSY
jgi:hypothetical protein